VQGGAAAPTLQHGELTRRRRGTGKVTRARGCAIGSTRDEPQECSSKIFYSGRNYRSEPGVVGKENRKGPVIHQKKWVSREKKSKSIGRTKKKRKVVKKRRSGVGGLRYGEKFQVQKGSNRSSGGEGEMVGKISGGRFLLTKRAGPNRMPGDGNYNSSALRRR